ncbi:hypothetical protein MRX96_023248 [Rhipicephalus microplus]
MSLSEIHQLEQILFGCAAHSLQLSVKDAVRQNCRTQRIPSEGEAERGGAVSTVAPGHRTPTNGRAARVAAAPTWRRGAGAHLSR